MGKFFQRNEADHQRTGVGGPPPPWVVGYIVGLGVGFVLDTVVVDVLLVDAGVVVVVVVDVVVDVVVVVGGASTFKEYKCETLKYYFKSM